MKLNIKQISLAAAWAASMAAAGTVYFETRRDPNELGLLGPAMLIYCGLASLYIGTKIEFRNKKKGQSAVHDVRTNAKWLKALKKPYDLSPHLKKSVFVGLNPIERSPQKMEPVHLPFETFTKNHTAMIGASRTGKSKIAGLILVQLLEGKGQATGGNAVVVFDPKDDEFLPGILNTAAKRLKKPFVYINLREQTPQINPFKGTTQEQREQCLQSALNLDPSGDPAVDYHRGEDRDACATAVNTGAINMPALLEVCMPLKEVTGRTNFWRELRMLGRVQAFHTNESPDLERVIEQGGVIYVVGDTDDLNVMAAQKLLLTRVTQIIKARERATARQCTVMIDETKYLLSNTILRAIGTLADRRCNMLLAFQSYGDLEDCGSLKPQAVLGAVKNNCTLKFVYKLDDRSTAEDFCLMAGEEAIRVEVVNKTMQDGLEQGAWQEAARQAVTLDMLTTCAPKPIRDEASVCWVFGLGEAFPIATMHLPAGEPPTLRPMPSTEVQPKLTAQGVI